MKRYHSAPRSAYAVYAVYAVRLMSRMRFGPGIYLYLSPSESPTRTRDLERWLQRVTELSTMMSAEGRGWDMNIGRHAV